MPIHSGDVSISGKAVRSVYYTYYITIQHYCSVSLLNLFDCDSITIFSIYLYMYMYYCCFSCRQIVSSNVRTCSALLPSLGSPSRDVIIAKASFSDVIEGSIYFVSTTIIHCRLHIFLHSYRSKNCLWLSKLAKLTL